MSIFRLEPMKSAFSKKKKKGSMFILHNSVNIISQVTVSCIVNNLCHWLKACDENKEGCDLNNIS